MYISRSIPKIMSISRDASSRSTTRTEPKTFLETYNSMVSLKRDLYYKEIINSHKDLILQRTEDFIDDVIHRYKNRYISKNDMFTEVEALKCKTHFVNKLVYEKITYIKKTFCRPKGYSKKPSYTGGKYKKQ